jgi:hypothetical protein
MIEGWLEKLPNAGLMLRPYDREVRRLGSSRVFAEAAGLDLPELPGGGKQSVNLGLHRGLLDIARRSNFELSPEEAGKLFRALLEIGPKLDLPPNQEVELFGAQARAEMVAHFTPIHDWISDLHGKPFFDDIQAIGELVLYDEIDVNAIAMEEIRAGHMQFFTSAGKDFIEAFKPERNFPKRHASLASHER